MAQEQQIVELIIDASQANAGSQVFEQAANRIQQSSERATASVDKLGQSIDQAGQKMSQAGQRSGAAAMELQVAATDKATAAMRQLAEAQETMIRRMQTGAFNVFDQTATLGALAQLKQQLERGGAGATAPLVVGAPERAGLNVAATAITADAIVPLTDEVFSAIHPSGALSRAARFVRQAEVSDTSAGSDIAKIHASESIATGAALSPVAQAAGNIAGTGSTSEQVLAASYERLALSNDRVTLATQAAAAAKAVPSPDLLPITTIEDATVRPSILRGVGTDLARQRTIEERAAYGATSVMDVKFASDALQNSVAKASIGGETIGERAAAVRAVLPAPHVEASQIDVGAFLQSRKPVNDVDVEAWNKNNARVKETGGALEDMAPAAAAATTATKALGAAVETVGHHATGTSSRIREFVVILRELGRGDFSRIFGSIALELQNFNLLRFLFDPFVLGAAALGGALALVETRAIKIGSELRQFQTDVKFFGDQNTGGSITPQYLQQQVVPQVAAAGHVSTPTAFAITQNINRAQINPDLAGDITKVAESLHTLNGGDTQEWAQKLTAALAGGYSELSKFASETKIIDANTLDDLRSFAEAGNKQALQQAAVQAALEKTTAATRDAKGVATEAGETIKDAWNNALDALANSAPIEKLNNGLLGVLDTIKEIATHGDWAEAIGKSIEKNLGVGNPSDFVGKLIDKYTGGGLLKQVGPTIDKVASASQLSSTSAYANREDLVKALAERGNETPDRVRTELAGPSQLIAGTSLALTGNSENIVKNTDALVQVKTALDAAAQSFTAAASTAGHALEAGGAISGALTTSVAGASPSESELLGKLKEGESGGRYNLLHYPTPGQSSIVSSLDDVEKASVTKNSHAFGAYGFEPRTYREAANALGFNPQDISDQRQDTAALWELRQKGLTPWAQTAARLGLTAAPLNAGVPSATSAPLFDVSSALGGPSSGPLVSTTPEIIARQRAGSAAPNIGTSLTSAQVGGGLDAEHLQKINEALKLPAQDDSSIKRLNEEIRAYQDAAGNIGKEGVAAQLATTSQNAYNQAVKDGATGWTLNARVQAAVGDAMARVAGANDVAAAQAKRGSDAALGVAGAYDKSAVAATTAAAAYQAENEHIARGVDSHRAQIQILTTETAQAVQFGALRIDSSRQQLAANQRLAEAAGQSANAEQEQEIRNRAIANTLDASTKAAAAYEVALKGGNQAEIQHAAVAKAAADAETKKTEEIERANVAAQQTRNIEDQSRGLRDQSEVLSREASLHGQSTTEIERQVGYLRVQQELRDKFSEAPQSKQDEFADQANAVVDMTAALRQAQQEQQRIDELFHSIAGTVSGELTKSLDDALKRTPLEAAEHWKHFWLDFRTQGKQAIADILTEIAKVAFLNPAIGTTAGALGLGQVAQQTGTFGGLFTGGAAVAAAGGTAAGASPISGSQVALNVSGLANGSAIFGANVPGSAVFQSGNTVTVQGGAQQVSGAGEAVQSAAGGTGLSADEVQALLDQQTTPLGSASQSTAPLLETFLGTITAAAAGTAQAAVAPTTDQGPAGPSVFLVPGTDNAISGSSSLAPAEVLPAAAALATGVASPSATPAATAAAPGLVSPGNIGGAVSAVSGLTSLLSQPGLLPSFISGSGGAGGLFGAGGITGAINSFGANYLGFAPGTIPAAGATSLLPNAVGDAGALSDTQLSSLAAADSGLFGTSATLSSALSGAGAGFGAGTLLNSLLGGNQLTGTIGAGAGSLLGAAIGSFLLPGIGTLIGGLVGGTAGGGLGGLLGPGPSGQSAGVTIGTGGAQTFEDAGGSAANIQSSDQVAGQISSFVQALGQLTDAQGKAIGTINSGLVAVSSNNVSGITVTGGGIAGGNFGQNAANAVTQTELQIIQGLGNVSDQEKQVFAKITDPSQLQAAVQFLDVYTKLNVTSQQLTASLTGNTNQIGPFSQALTQVNTTFTQLTAQATQFGVSAAPINAALNAVTQTLNQDFAVNVSEALSTAIDGGNDFIASLIKIHQQYVQNINDAEALATGVPTGTTTGFAGGTMGAAGGTPPGWILVGERGAEWMFQAGGATVLPNGQQPADVPDPLGRSFADGTIGVGDIAGQVPGVASAISQASGGPSLIGAAGDAFGISSDVLSTIGDVAAGVPIVGGLVGLATGGNPLSSGIGIASSLAALALANPLIGVIGGLVALVANLFGPPPSNKASGDLIDLSSGAITDFQSAGDSKADAVVQQVSQAIAASSLVLQQASGGSISGAVSVQDGSRDGLKTSYSGPQGNIDAKWGSASEAVGQWALAIAHNLVGIAPALQSALSGVTDPNQLMAVIQAYAASQTPAASAAAAAPAAPQPPAPPQLYAITQPGGPSYVGALSAEDAAWWQGAGATLSPYTGGAPAARSGATLYQITQPGGPAYVGDLTANDVSWWQNDGATLTPYGTLPPLLAGAALYSIAQPGGGPSYLGDLAPADVAWWQNDGATVTSSPDGTPPTPRQGAALYTINQGAGAWYIGDLMPADAQWWENAGATLTPFSATAATVAPAAAPAATPYAGPGFAAGTGGTPPGWILVGEQGPEWMLQPGGATVLPNGVLPNETVSPIGRSFADGTAAAAAAPDATAAITDAIAGTEAAQAGPVLAALGIDQLTTAIQNLATVAPEIAQMAQNLINGGNALPDILTQGIQALTDPLELAIEKEKALGAERVAVAQQTGEDLVKAEQLNSANMVAAITSAAGNPTALAQFSYPNNPTAQEYIQAAPALAGFSTQQLEQVFADTFSSSPELAALAQSFITTGTALPDTITQSLEGVVNPLLLAIQQQSAQAQARTEVGVVAGQDPNQVAALNTASITQAIIQQIGNPAALQALAAHGSAQGLTALQAGPAIAGLGLDQLTALVNAIGTASPNLTDMINALIASGNALPDALTQATEAIVESGVLAVQKAQALAYEQVQAAGPAGQNVGEAQALGTAEVAQATAQATGTEVPLGPLPDWVTQLEEAVTAPLQLAIQKEQAAGIQRVQIAETTGADLVRVQQENADAIAQIWYQATQQLTSLRNDITSGSLSGLTAANQVTASIEQFNTVLGLVQGGNTSFINELATAGQAAVQAAQTAYGNGPQTASVREQVYQAISPLLVSSTGYPTSNLAAVAAGDTTGTTATGTTTDLQDNTSALQDLTAAITGTTTGTAAGSQPLILTSGSGSAVSTTSASAGEAAVETAQQLYGNGPQTASVSQQALTSAASTATSSSSSSAANDNLTTNPVTGQSFTGTGITAVTPNFPTFPSASTLSGALSDAIASQATAADWATINQAVQAGILNSANQPGYALVIQQALQWAAGQAVDPSAGLTQALSDALTGTPTLEEWELINQAVNAGILSAVAQPTYAPVIRQAQVIANAQAVSLSQIPNNQTAYSTVINGLPAAAAGMASTPPGLIMVGEEGPEWYQPANDNRWTQVGVQGPEIIDQPGGAQIIPFPKVPPIAGFAEGTTGTFYVPPSAGSAAGDANKALIAEVAALRKQVWASQMSADQNAKTQHALTQQTNTNLGPPLRAPVRRAVG